MRLVLFSALTVPQVSQSPKSVDARCRKGRICLAGVEGAYGGSLGRQGFSEPPPRLPQVWGSHWTGIAAAWVPRAQTIPRWGLDGVCLYWQARGLLCHLPGVHHRPVSAATVEGYQTPAGPSSSCWAAGSPRTEQYLWRSVCHPTTLHTQTPSQNGAGSAQHPALGACLPGSPVAHAPEPRSRPW